MPIQIDCPNPDCRRLLKFKEEHAGKRARCPSCSTIVEIPSADEDLEVVDADYDDSGHVKEAGRPGPPAAATI